MGENRVRESVRDVADAETRVLPSCNACGGVLLCAGGACDDDADDCMPLCLRLVFRGSRACAVIICCDTSPYIPFAIALCECFQLYRQNLCKHMIHV